MDAIWDRYIPNSIKQSSHKKRINLETIHIQRVPPTSPINTSWGSFLMLGELTLYYLSDSMKSWVTCGNILGCSYDEPIPTVDQYMMNLDSLNPYWHKDSSR